MALRDLIIRMSADTATLKRDFDKSATLVRGFCDGTRRMFDQLKSIAMLGGLTYGVTRAFRLLSTGLVDTVKQADATAKSISRLGGVNAAFLQELRYVAKLSDVEFETLLNSIIRFSRESGESLEDVLPAMAVQYNRLKTNVEKIQFVYDNFGRTGSKFAQILSQGIDEINRMRQEAHKLGVILDPALLKSSENLLDSWTCLTESWQGFKNSILDVSTLNALANLLNSLAYAVADLRLKFVELKSEIRPTFEAVGRFVDKYSGLLDTMLAAPGLAQFRPIFEAMMLLRREMQAGGKAAAEAGEEIANLYGTVYGISERIKAPFPVQTKKYILELQGALADFARNCQDYALQIENAFIGSFRAIEDVLVDFCQTGKFRFSELIRYVHAEFTRAILRIGLIGPLAESIAGALPWASWVMKPLSRQAGGPMVPGLSYIAHGGEAIVRGPGHVVSAKEVQQLLRDVRTIAAACRPAGSGPGPTFRQNVPLLQRQLAQQISASLR